MLTTLTLRVTCARWLKPYLYALVFFAVLMGAQPDQEKLARVIRRGIKVTPC